MDQDQILEQTNSNKKNIQPIFVCRKCKDCLTQEEKTEIITSWKENGVDINALNLNTPAQSQIKEQLQNSKLSNNQNYLPIQGFNHGQHEPQFDENEMLVNVENQGEEPEYEEFNEVELHDIQSQIEGAQVNKIKYYCRAIVTLIFLLLTLFMAKGHADVINKYFKDQNITQDVLDKLQEDLDKFGFKNIRIFTLDLMALANLAEFYFYLCIGVSCVFLLPRFFEQTIKINQKIGKCVKFIVYLAAFVCVLCFFTWMTANYEQMIYEYTIDFSEIQDAQEENGQEAEVLYGFPSQEFVGIWGYSFKHWDEAQLTLGGYDNFDTADDVYHYCVAMQYIPLYIGITIFCFEVIAQILIFRIKKQQQQKSNEIALKIKNDDLASKDGQSGVELKTTNKQSYDLQSNSPSNDDKISVNQVQPAHDIKQQGQDVALDIENNNINIVEVQLVREKSKEKDMEDFISEKAAIDSTNVYNADEQNNSNEDNTNRINNNDINNKNFKKFDLNSNRANSNESLKNENQDQKSVKEEYQPSTNSDPSVQSQQHGSQQRLQSKQSSEEGQLGTQNNQDYIENQQKQFEENQDKQFPIFANQSKQSISNNNIENTESERNKEQNEAKSLQMIQTEEDINDEQLQEANKQNGTRNSFRKLSVLAENGLLTFQQDSLPQLPQNLVQSTQKIQVGSNKTMED